MSFAQDGAALSIGSYDHLVRIWRFRPARRARRDPRARSEGSVGTRLLARQPHTRLGRRRPPNPDVGYRDGPRAVHDEPSRGLVTSLAFSRDGRTLASGSFDKARPVILWDVAPDIRGSSSTGTTIASGLWLSVPTIDILASGGDDRTLKLWNVTDGRLLRTISERSGRVFGVVLQPGRTHGRFHRGESSDCLHRHNDWCEPSGRDGRSARCPGILDRRIAAVLRPRCRPDHNMGRRQRRAGRIASRTQLRDLVTGRVAGWCDPGFGGR